MSCTKQNMFNSLALKLLDLKIQVKQNLYFFFWIGFVLSNSVYCLCGLNVWEAPQFIFSVRGLNRGIREHWLPLEV